MVSLDHGSTGEVPLHAAAEHGITQEVVKLSEVKRGFGLVARRWVVECDVGWMRRVRRLARDQQRLADVVTGLDHLRDEIMGKQVILLLSAV